MLFPGAFGLYLFDYQNYRPDWLQFDVFTVYSSYLSTRILTFIKNNQGDEISTLLFFIGAFLLMASAEKNERSFHQENRIKALAWSAVVSMFFFLTGYLLLHGTAIVYTALVLPYLMPFVYLTIFYRLNKKVDTWNR